MSSPFLRFVRATGLAAVAAFLFGLIRSARHQPTPPASGAASWEPLTDEDPVPTRSGPVTFTEPATPADDDAADDEPEAPQSFAAADTASGWVEPDAMGECPASHPIKGNDQSKIFHVPGGMSYSRTKAERCYCDEASAEADGYRKAKR